MFIGAALATIAFIAVVSNLTNLTFWLSATPYSFLLLIRVCGKAARIFAVCTGISDADE